MLKTPKAHHRGKTVSHRHAPKQEALAAKKLGGATTKGSGCGPEKGDVRIQGVARIEAKCTKHQSFSITQKMIDKIEDAALSSGELPVITVDFISPEGAVTRSVCVVPSYALEMIVGGIRDATG